MMKVNNFTIVASCVLSILNSNVSSFSILQAASTTKQQNEPQRQRCFHDDHITSSTVTTSPVPSRLSSTSLCMGRAAAVRASTKAKTDLVKAKTNSLYGKRIIMAVKSGGSPDPNANRSLADVIKSAKSHNVPVDNINRAIKKASEANVGDFKASTFEAYGSGGASFVINVLTDNGNRASADVKSTVNKRGGKIAESGSVLFMYDRKGKVDVPVASIDEEALLEAAIEVDCDDYEMEELDSSDGDAAADIPDVTTIYTEVADANKMVEAVASMGYEEGVKMSLVHVALAPIQCTDEEFEKNMEVIDALEELDDVDSVEHNMLN